MGMSPLKSKHEMTHHQVIRLTPKAPFNFDATMRKPDHFPSADNAWQQGTRWQTMCWQGLLLGLKFENQGTIEQPAIALSIWSREALGQDFLDSLIEEISYRCCLKLDLGDFNRQFANDPLLGPIIQKWRGMRPLNSNTLYEYLIITIALQNATVRRSVNMMQTLFEGYGTLLAYDGQELFCFWQPEDLKDVAEEDLRRLKVGYRARSIKRVTEALVNGEIDEFALRHQSREKQRQALLALYGIGPASVGYLLFDVFHHLDELDHISPWEQKIYSKLFFGTEPDEPVLAADLLRFFKERFGNYRMLAVHYVWEDLFWQRQHSPLPWLEKLIRL